MFGRDLILIFFLFGRILAHGTNFSLDLSDYGNSANGTRIQLWGSGFGVNQIWVPTEQVFIEDQHIYSLRNCQGGTEDQDTYSKACFHPRLV
jgi:hypothetical protein